MLAGTLVAALLGRRLPRTLGLVKQRRDFVLPLRTHHHFHFSYRLRYAHVTMSMRCRSFRFATHCPSASAVGTAPLAFSFVRLLPLAAQPCHDPLSFGATTRRGSPAPKSALRVAALACGGLTSPGSPVCFRSRCYARRLSVARHYAPSSPWPNPRFEGTAEKLRFSVPRRLRRRAAPQA